jgi:hypothetical protein
MLKDEEFHWSVLLTPLFEGLVMMENRPTATKFNGLESLPKITFLTNNEIGSVLAAPSIEQQERLPLRVNPEG